METPARFTFSPDGSTTVFQIPVRMKGENYIRVDVDDITINDRNKFDLVNNSVVFVSAADVPAGSKLDILVVQTDEGIANLGNVNAMDLVSQNIATINSVAQNMPNVIAATTVAADAQAVAQKALDASNAVINMNVSTGDAGTVAKWTVVGDQGYLTIPRGSQGPQGSQGPTGPQGAQGPAGGPGEQGPTGPQGIQGPEGPRGPRGFIGPQGDKGDVGPQGPEGPIGPQGPQGTQGPVGPEGPVGQQGPVGPVGPQGIQGPVGPEGPRGPQGDIGAKGPAGDQGPMGTPALGLAFGQFRLDPNGDLIVEYYGGASGNDFTIDANGYLHVEIN